MMKVVVGERTARPAARIIRDTPASRIACLDEREWRNSDAVTGRLVSCGSRLHAAWTGEHSIEPDRAAPGTPCAGKHGPGPGSLSRLPAGGAMAAFGIDRKLQY